MRAEIWKVLGTLKCGRESIIIIDKNLDALLGIADRHYILEKGRRVWSGDSTALAADEQARLDYLGV